MKLGLRVLLGLGVCVVSLTAALVGTEVLLRELHPVDYRKPVERVSTGGYNDYVHRASPVPGLAYELAPGVRKRVDDMLIETNSLGMRDDEPASEKGADLVRIAAVGDSVTFGFGVSAAEAWPSVLERLLNDAY